LQKKNNERKHDDTHTRENDDEKDKQQHTMCAIEWRRWNKKKRGNEMKW